MPEYPIGEMNLSSFDPLQPFLACSSTGFLGHGLLQSSEQLAPASSRMSAAVEWITDTMAADQTAAIRILGRMTVSTKLRPRFDLLKGS